MTALAARKPANNRRGQASKAANSATLMQTAEKKNSTVDLLLGALENLFVPLARIMIRNGVMADAVLHSIRRSYLRAAKLVIEEQGAAPTPARLCLFMGITRKDYDRIASPSGGLDVAVQSKQDQIGALISTWFMDQRFQTPFVDSPRDLSFAETNRKSPNFLELASECAPSIPVPALIDELEQLGIVAVDHDRRTVRVLKRAYLPEPYDEARIEHLGRSIRYLIDTIDANLHKEGQGKGLFERLVLSDFAVSANDSREFDALLRVEGQKLLENLDTWLARRTPEAGGARIGAALFHFVDADSAAPTPSPARKVPRDQAEPSAPESTASKPRDPEPIEIDVLTYRRPGDIET